MFGSSSRAYAALSPALGAACGSTAAAATASRVLPPARYHVLREPIPYLIGLKLQNDIIDARLAARKEDASQGKQDVLLLLEHTPTYTTGRRDNSPNPDTMHPEERKVQHVGADFHITKRGGQVTYHGPGQLVGYPILDLNAMEVSLGVIAEGVVVLLAVRARAHSKTPTRCYVEYLQALLADYVRDELGLAVVAPHPDGHVGIFASPTEKLASIGIHLRHRITSHGFAINVTREPVAWFDLVMACGLADVRAVGIHELLERQRQPGLEAAGYQKPLPSVRDVAHALVPRFKEVFTRSFEPLEASGGSDMGQLQELIGRAEEAASAANKAAGGWPSRPHARSRIAA